MTAPFGQTYTLYGSLTEALGAGYMVQCEQLDDGAIRLEQRFGHEWKFAQVIMREA